MTRDTRTVARIAALVATFVAAAAPAARAQSAGPAGRFDVAFGALWMGRTPLVSGDADETTSTGGTLPLFSTSTTLAAMTGGELAVEYRVVRKLDVFGAASYGKRELQIAVTNDREGGASTTATESLQQFTLTGGARYTLTESRIAPFLRAEIGRLRQLHEGKTLAENGTVFMAGAGIDLRLTSPGSTGRALALRIDGRAVVRSKSFLINTDKIAPAVGVSLVVPF